MVEFTADVTQGSPLSGYLSLVEAEPPLAQAKGGCC